MADNEENNRLIIAIMILMLICLLFFVSSSVPFGRMSYPSQGENGGNGAPGVLQGTVYYNGGVIPLSIPLDTADGSYLELINAKSYISAGKTFSDIDGQYAFPGIQPGDYILKAVYQNNEIGSINLTINSGNVTSMDLTTNRMPMN